MDSYENWKWGNCSHWINYTSTDHLDLITMDSEDSMMCVGCGRLEQPCLLVFWSSSSSYVLLSAGIVLV